MGFFDIPPAAIDFIIDGGGSAITTGEKGHVRMPFAGTILNVALAADKSGNIVVDIWKSTLAGFPPVVGGSICNGSKPTLSSEQVMYDEALSGWTTSFLEGDFLAFNVDSAATVTRVTVALTVTRS